MALRYGWCGLGQMGEAMTANMLAAKLPLIVWNRTAEKCEPIKALGAEVAATPQEVFEKSDIVYVMLSTPDVAKAWWSENAKFSTGKMVVDCATLGVDAMVYIAGLVTGVGGKFLEAPVAGHSGMAKAKTIQFLVAGDKEVFEKAGSSMDTMAKGKEYLGEQVGLASKMKLVVNSTLGNMMLTCAEAVSLSEKVGLDPEKYLEIIGNHPALSNGLTKMFGPKMLADEHAPLFMTKHMEKDMGLALEMATPAGQAMPLSAASRRLYKAALEDGQSDYHMSSVFRTLKKMEAPGKGKGKGKGKIVAKPPPQKKPKFQKVGSLSPGSTGVNLVVKVVSDGAAVEGGKGTSFFEFTCGDASGQIVLSLTAAQKDIVQKDSVVIVRNAGVKMIKGYMRLCVDKWGKLETSTEETVEEVCCAPGRAAAKASAGRANFGAPVTAFFSTPEGVSYNVYLRTDSTVEDAKTALTELTGIPEVEQQIFGTDDPNVELDDDSRPFSVLACANTVFQIVFTSSLHEARSSRCFFRYRCCGTDAERFNRATEACDLEELISLLHSDQVVEHVLEPKHPWASDPDSIGALAGAALVAMASAEALDSESASNGDHEAADWMIVKRTTFASGGIPILVEFLRSEQEDRVHVAVLALSFLTAEPEGAANAKAAYDAGAMPLLIDMLGSKSKPQASAAATALRNMFVIDDDYRQAFVELGGLKGLVAQLPDISQIPPDDTVLETILHLQDLMEDPQGSTFREYARLALKMGTLIKLELLKGTQCADLQASVIELVETLEKSGQETITPRQSPRGGD